MGATADLSTESKIKSRPSCKSVNRRTGSDVRGHADHGAPTTVRKRWVRSAVRFTVLVATDIGTFLTVRWLVVDVWPSVLIDTGLLSASSVFGPGFLPGARFAVALVLSLSLTRAYGPGGMRRDMGPIVAGVLLASLLVMYASAWDMSLLHVTRSFAWVVGTLGLALVLSRFVVELAVRVFRPCIGGARTILVSCSDGDLAVPTGFLEDSRELSLVGRVDFGKEGLAELDDMASELSRVIRDEHAETVLLWGAFSEAGFAHAVDQALVNDCRILAGRRTPGTVSVEPRGVWVEGRPLVELTIPKLQASQLAAKRILDVVGATIGLIVVGPILAVIAICVRMESPGPVLFGHTRLGIRGRRFRCYKFRSMRKDAEERLSTDRSLYDLYIENDFKIPIDRDPRLTRVGRFLRRMSLDELPQLFNVLKGDMSLVGPRPIVPDELDHYSRAAQLFLSQKPGITGAWVVNGRSQIGYPERVDVELEYVRTWSLLSDFWILLRTIPSVLLRRGVF